MDQPIRRAPPSVPEQLLFRALAESCPVGVFHTDVQGRALYTNPRWQEIFGLTLAESLGDGWQRGIHPEDLPTLLAGWSAAAVAGVDYSAAFRVVRPDGTVLHVRGRARRIPTEDGSHAGHVGTIEDVTDQVRHEAELRASREQLQRALEGSRLALWDLNARTGRIYLSEQWSEMLGGEPRAMELTADELLALVPDEDRATIGEALERVLRGGDPGYAVDHRVRHRDGRLLWIHSAGKVSERDADGRVLRIIGTNSDISDSKRIEQELRVARDAANAASHAKTQFLANMSHEIRTPLNGIVGMTKLLLDEQLPPRHRQHAELIDSSAHSLLALVNDILDVSKIEAGQMTIEHVPFDLHALVDDVATLFRLRAAEKSLQFRVDRQAGVPQYVTGDPTRLRQVLVNLLGNALKFTRAGWIGFGVAAAGAGPGVQLRFTVADTGAGISKEAQARLFTRFMQEDTSTSRRFGGTGLGLAIVHQLAQLMRGRVEVESTPGEGSVFTVTVQLAAADGPPEASGFQPLAPAPAALRLLLAEDNTTNQMVALGMLRKLGYTNVTVAGDGEQAVAKAADGGFDVVLMDCHMPNMDGYEATRRLRAAGFRAPIIAMTANAISGDRERCLAAGMNDYIAKPVAVKVLGQALERWGLGGAALAPPAPPAAPPAASSMPVFDRVAFDGRFGGDPELAALALRSFLRSTPEVLERLQAALAAERRADIALHAHSAKGAGAMVGAERFRAIAAAMEEGAQGAPLDALRADAAKLGDALREFRELQEQDGAGG